MRVWSLNAVINPLAMTVGRKNANYIDKDSDDIITSLISAYSGL